MKRTKITRRALVRPLVFLLNLVALCIYNNFRSLGSLQRMTGNVIYRDVRRNYPPVLGVKESIDILVNEGASVGRFGDGEFRLCRNKSIRFQSVSPQLVRRLREILNNDAGGFYAAIPPLASNAVMATEKSRANWRNIHICNWRVTRTLQGHRPRLSSFISRPDLHKFSCNEYQDYIRAIKAVWQSRDVVLVCNEDIHQISLARDLFDNIKSLHLVPAPSKDAYHCYADILDNTKQYPADYLFLLACGPTATVLAYDLNKLSRQAVDIGHLPLMHERSFQRD